jgi:hypothetical protein
MKKSKLKKQNEILRRTIRLLYEDIDTLLGDDVYEKALIKMDRELTKKIFDETWRGL